MTTKKQQRKRRHVRVRAKLQGTAKRPRLIVFRSINSTYAQLIDDEKGTTICAASDLKIKKGTKLEKATETGKAIGKIALEKKIEECVFDRNGYKYHGRIKAIADGAREAGLKF
ncbi:MAG: 50S ribosomal protein L18 [Patescibacteria group bacterium]|nr:50S ribosomal protein L18 [Patescibacteria group bacterium]